MKIAKILCPLMLLSFLVFSYANAASDRVVNPDKREVDKHVCEKSGGYFDESDDGDTGCFFKDGSFTACKDSDCVFCASPQIPKQECKKVREQFSSGGLKGSAITNNGTATQIMAQPDKPVSPVARMQPNPTTPLVAPVKETANAPAVAPTAPKIDARGGRIQATGSSRPDVTQGVRKNSDVGVAALTKGECTKLGGTVKKMSMCKSGSGCQTTDENGSSHGVCITPAELLAPTFDREVQGNDSNGQGTSNSRLDFNKAIPQAGSTMAVPLTSQECTGLGGMVIATTNCESKGQKACSTVDQHGVIRIACINKVSK